MVVGPSLRDRIPTDAFLVFFIVVCESFACSVIYYYVFDMLSFACVMCGLLVLCVNQLHVYGACFWLITSLLWQARDIIESVIACQVAHGFHRNILGLRVAHDVRRSKNEECYYFWSKTLNVELRSLLLILLLGLMSHESYM